MASYPEGRFVAISQTAERDSHLRRGNESSAARQEFLIETPIERLIENPADKDPSITRTAIRIYIFHRTDEGDFSLKHLKGLSRCNDLERRWNQHCIPLKDIGTTQGKWVTETVGLRILNGGGPSQCGIKGPYAPMEPVFHSLSLIRGFAMCLIFKFQLTGSSQYFSPLVFRPPVVPEISFAQEDQLPSDQWMDSVRIEVWKEDGSAYSLNVRFIDRRKIFTRRSVLVQPRLFDIMEVTVESAELVVYDEKPGRV